MENLYEYLSDVDTIQDSQNYQEVTEGKYSTGKIYIFGTNGPDHAAVDDYWFVKQKTGSGCPWSVLTAERETSLI